MDHPGRVRTLDIPGIEDLEPLGRGGFGTVYRGWQPSLRREVAVKVLDAPMLDADSERRFEREAMAMGSLSGHPNVVPVYAAGAVDGRPYLVMPLLRDGSLQDRLGAGTLRPEEVVSTGRGVADALVAAHAAGILHRDVKPANVLHTSHGAAQLADFGVARVADTTNTMGGPVVATVAYAAPEVLAGEPATERSDLYSLGATLYAAATGRPPYEAGPDDTPMSLAIRVMSAEPPDLRAAGVPAALVEVIERAMAREPQDRYGSAAELRQALDEVDLEAPTAVQDATVALPALAPTTVQPITQERPVVVEPRRPTPRPNRGGGRRLLVLGVVVLLIAAVLAALLLQDDDGDSSRSAAGTSTTAPADPPTSETTPSSAPTTAAPAVEPAPTGSGSDAADATRRYYELMDAGRVDEGWASLSPAYQARTGEGSYRRFWSTIDSVRVLEVAGEGLTSRATLRYTRTDGTASTEEVTLRFVERDDGTLLIDDYRVG